jgi:phosphoadenosine phosphosulfate reductase
LSKDITYIKSHLTQSIEENLQLIAEIFADTATLSTSFSEEDQLLTHIIATQKLPISIFTLDTGRHFPETYSVWNATLEKYNHPITAYYPNAETIQKFTTAFGPNSFYNSVDERKKCCAIRKVEPLKRALAGKKVWITGIRAEHSTNRKEMTQIEWDAEKEIICFHPLLYWNSEAVKKYIDLYQIPTNTLHQRGFVSIGCAPCTRAILHGEDMRAGRWWWEDNNKKECGLHTRNTQQQSH